VENCGAAKEGHLIFFAPSDDREEGLPQWWWELWHFLLALEFKQIIDPNFSVLMVAGRAMNVQKAIPIPDQPSCINTHDGKRHDLNKFSRSDVTTLGDIICSYLQHPEIKSLGPDGKTCKAHTRGLLQQMKINGGLQHCIGKEISRFEHGEEDFIENIDDVCIHYDGGRVDANESVIAEISAHGLRRTTKETGLDRKTIRAILRGEKVKAATLAKLVIGMRLQQE
jgi:hypothetical protein